MLARRRQHTRIIADDVEPTSAMKGVLVKAAHVVREFLRRDCWQRRRHHGCGRRESILNCCVVVEQFAHDPVIAKFFRDRRIDIHGQPAMPVLIQHERRPRDPEFARKLLFRPIPLPSQCQKVRDDARRLLLHEWRGLQV